MPRRRREPNPRTKRAVSRWTARTIPVLLAGAVGYCTYVIVSPLCIKHLLHKRHHPSAVISILVIYFLLLGLWLTSFLRLWYMVTFDPPYLPLGSGAPLARQTRKQKVKDAVTGTEYIGRDVEKQHNDPDSPGLEKFYTKDVFVVEQDGRPKWCSHCANWKPDRTHHCTDAGRCVYKMDHFCPWVGGPVGENNFKFFIQFTAYTALTCANLVVVMAIYVHEQVVSEGSQHINSNFIAVIVLAGFFGLFTASMFCGSGNLAARNLTQVENINRKTKIYTLAIHKMPFIETNSQDQAYHEITYPLPITSNSARSDNPLDPRTVVINGSDDSHVPDGQNQHSAPSREAASSNSSHTTTDVSPSPPRITSTASYAFDHSSTRPEPESAFRHRDHNATRTFAILKTPAGTNPWDLGSYMKNWKTVMGINIMDWFLPIRRSPCCKHEPEEVESWFEFGPAVEDLRVRFGFLGRERKWSDKGSDREWRGRTKSKKRRRRDQSAQNETRHDRRKDDKQDKPISMEEDGLDEIHNIELTEMERSDMQEH